MMMWAEYAPSAPISLMNERVTHSGLPSGSVNYTRNTELQSQCVTVRPNGSLLGSQTYHAPWLKATSQGRLDHPGPTFTKVTKSEHSSLVNDTTKIMNAQGIRQGKINTQHVSDKSRVNKFNK